MCLRACVCGCVCAKTYGSGCARERLKFHSPTVRKSWKASLLPGISLFPRTITPSMSTNNPNSGVFLRPAEAVLEVVDFQQTDLSIFKRSGRKSHRGTKPLILFNYVGTYWHSSKRIKISRGCQNKNNARWQWWMMIYM